MKIIKKLLHLYESPIVLGKSPVMNVGMYVQVSSI
jgi:hypothetical protein